MPKFRVEYHMISTFIAASLLQRTLMKKRKRLQVRL